LLFCFPSGGGGPPPGGAPPPPPRNNPNMLRFFLLRGARCSAAFGALRGGRFNYFPLETYTP
jgi:hypothetical protein